MSFEWDGTPITNDMIQSINLDAESMTGTVTFKIPNPLGGEMSTTTQAYEITEADLGGAAGVAAVRAWARGCIVDTVGA
jgi:hypothetical protein